MVKLDGYLWLLSSYNSKFSIVISAGLNASNFYREKNHICYSVAAFRVTQFVIFPIPPNTGYSEIEMEKDETFCAKFIYTTSF